MVEHMLTTTDNPFNPFTDFDTWYAYDLVLGHHTSALLARVVRTSEELSEEDESQAMEDAIDKIVTENVSGVHRKVAYDSSLIA